MAKPTKPTKTKNTASVARVLMPRFGGNPLCASRSGAIATRCAVGAFAEGSTVEIWALDAPLARRTATFDVGSSHVLTRVAITPDGKRAAAVSRENKVFVLEEGREPVVMPGRYVAFDDEGRIWTQPTYNMLLRSPDGLEMPTEEYALATTRGDGVHGMASYGAVRVRLPDEARSLPLGGEPESANIVGLCESRPLVAVFSGMTIHVINWETRETVMKVEARSVGQLSFSQDGSRLAALGSAVQVFDVPSGVEVLRDGGGNGQGFVGGFTPDGRIWAASGALYMFEIGKSRDGELGVAPVMSWSRDGQWLAVERGHESLAVIDVASGSERWRRHIDGGIHALSFSSSGDDSRLAVLARELQLLDPANGNVVATHPCESPGGLACSSDGSRLVLAGEELLILDGATGKKLKSLGASPDGWTRPVWSADGKRVAAARTDNQAVAFDVASGKKAGDLKADSLEALALVGDALVAAANRALKAKVLAGGAAKKWGVGAYVENGSLPVSDSAGRFVVMIEEDTVVLGADGQPLAELPGVALESAAISPDGALLAGARDGGLELWTL